MARFQHMRLLDVVEAVSDVATRDDETLATVASLSNSGKVRFCGHGYVSTLTPAAQRDGTLA